jgi:hypothetical protein
MNIEVQNATVFKAHGRRFFTKEAALNRCFWFRVREKYPCECEYETGYNCGVHKGNERFDKLHKRFLKIWRRK